MAGKRIAVFTLLTLVALALVLFASSGTQAQTYKPTFAYTVTDNTGGAASDTTNLIAIPSPNYNYEDSSLYTFTPIDGFSVTGPEIPIADKVGTLDAEVAVGLLGGPCSSPLPPLFNLENASVDNSEELSATEMYWVLKPMAFWPVPYRDKCENDIDDDGDTFVNDGCPKLPTDDDTDDTGENTAGRRANDGCPAVDTAESGAECDNDLDDDGDTTVNDGCDQVGDRSESGDECIDPESGDDCANDTDDDGDSFGISNNGVNDGCPAVGNGELLTNPLIPDYLERMPHFINDILDPDGRHDPEPPLQPRARYAGYTTVADMNIIIQFIVLNPGQLEKLPEIKAQMGSELGHPSLVVLDNPVSQEEAPGSISDFCTALETTTVLYATTVANQYDGSGGGVTARTNPPTDSGVLGSGTHMSRNYSQSERDADGDGIENDLDPCHYTADAWNPRAACTGSGPGDADCDGLPDTCDPKFTGIGTCINPDPAAKDCDGDGYNNRQDICPLVPSGCNTAECSQTWPKIWNPAWENMGDDEGFEANTDDGPGPDSIGNACDDSNDDGMEDGSGPNPGSGDCDDGADNDADTLIDGNDPDCVPFMDAAGVGKCRDAIDRDGDTYINDGCPQKGLAPEAGTDCDNDLDDDGDTRVNDGCPKKPTDDDGDTIANDGCPAVDTAESGAECANNLDDDGDTTVNDGCPKLASDDDTTDTGEDTAGRRVNDGCPAVDTAESGADCDNDVDDDGDTTVNDGCPKVGNRSESGDECIDPESGAECIDPEDPGVDDLSTIWGNDPSTGMFYHAMPWSAVTINAAVDTDGDGYSDALESTLGSCYDDSETSCTVQGFGTVGNPNPDPEDSMPESLVIDMTLTVGAGAPPKSGGLPSLDAPQSCNDGIDNDLDGKIDGLDDDALGCDESKYNPDDDRDGVANDTDNCSAIRNPEQTNTDMDLQNAGASVTGDGLGDPCDPNDDNDAGGAGSSFSFTDSLEWYIGTDPLDNCSNNTSHAAWPLDMNKDTYVTVVGDVLGYAGKIGLQVSANPPSTWSLRRLDLNGDDYITVVGDTLKYVGWIGLQCT